MIVELLNIKDKISKVLTVWLWVKGMSSSEKFCNLHIKSLLIWDIGDDEIISFFDVGLIIHF